MDTITAGELRARGLPIPDSIPDCAWVSRGALCYDFDQPFRWAEVSGTVRL